MLATISSNQVLVVSGETGCGKTNQVPQFIMEEAVARGQGSRVSIVCTQPRRVAAISVAERVAHERGERVGEGVGYQVRMDNKLPREQGSIIYCTTGILLQRMQSDRTLKQFTHVILDEIHERDIMADIILVIIKEILPARPDLKVVLMSATLNATQFSYLNNCPVLHIPGFMYPVTTFYLEDVLRDDRVQHVLQPGSSRHTTLHPAGGQVNPDRGRDQEDDLRETPVPLHPDQPDAPPG